MSPSTCIAVSTAILLSVLPAPDARSQTAPPSVPAAAAAPPSGRNAAAPASGPAPAYRSVFDGYRGYRDQPVGPWRAVNDRVRDIGGWQSYAREAEAAQVPQAAQGPHAAPPATAAASAVVPAPAGAHHGHGKP